MIIGESFLTWFVGAIIMAAIMGVLDNRKIKSFDGAESILCAVFWPITVVVFTIIGVYLMAQKFGELVTTKPPEKKK